MKKIVVLITTYQRPKMLLDLLKQIKTQSDNFTIDLLIFSDKSDSDYSAVISFLKKKFPFNFKFHKGSEHYGKASYWKIINFCYSSLQYKKFDYLIQLPDDIQLTDDFFTAAVNYWEVIRDPDKICLNILQDNSRKGKAMWTPIQPKVKIFNKIKFYKTGWVDLCFISTKKYLEELDYRIFPANKLFANKPGLSSGVGMQISHRIHEHKKNIYQVLLSLVIHDDHPSVMHPEHRKEVPLITNHKKRDMVTAGMAAIPSRTESLKEVVNSLLPQVDQLQIYLNNFKEIPSFLDHPQITVFRSQDHKGDLGDAGKFYQVEKIRGYHFTVDDDIIYPVDYVDCMIRNIEAHKRECVISCHGRIFGQLPVKTYYRGATEAFSCLHSLATDRYAHVCGTGVLAYHTDTIRLKLSDFPRSNMGDIWFSKRANELHIPILIIKHLRGWIRMSEKYDQDYSIYTACNRNDDYQTQITNSVKWNTLKTK